MKIEELQFDDTGLIPVIVQDAENGQVLMFAYADREALQKTLDTKQTHFWSRSRKELWRKGEGSGNVQEVTDVIIDCDGDCVLVLVNQEGVACHTGRRSCFYRNFEDGGDGAPGFGGAERAKSLDDVYRVIEDRKRNRRDNSYVSGLFSKGIDAILKKVGEEADETIIAAKNGDKEQIVYETTDLFFHSLITLAHFGLTPQDIYSELGRRFGKAKEDYGKQ